MFGINRERIVNNLKKISMSLCSYTRQPCDCKYLGTEDSVGRGEQCGCPEITSANKIFEVMTDKEYERLCKRANIYIR